MNINWWVLLYELIGGLALFLFGMDVMTRALKASAGSQLKIFLQKMTASRWKALLAGTGITAIIQSSSVTTVLAVGFVSAGIMQFESTLGIILGANIGTTITAQIIAFKVTKVALLLVIVGYLFTLVSNQKKHHEYGRVLLGLGLVFLGMNVMGEGMHPLKEYPPFLQIMHNLSNPLLGIAIGAIFTALVQSSSATTGVVIILAAQGLISTQGGISIIIGANIGTCVTALLSAIGKPRTAMQVAIAHVSFKIIGALLWVWFIPQLAEITEAITPRDLPRQIANAHTIFNVANAMLLIGFTSPVAKIISKIFPAKHTGKDGDIHLLNKYYLQNPGIAIELVDKELDKLYLKTNHTLSKGLTIALEGSQTDLEELRLSDKTIDFHQKQILSYLQQLQQGQLEKDETNLIKKQVEIANILEAAADLITTDMVEAADHRIQHGFYISDETNKLIKGIYSQSIASLSTAIRAYQTDDNTLASKVIASKKSFNKCSLEIKERLMVRLSQHDENRISIIRFETEIIESIGRLNSLARRIAKLQLG
ncbi:Na/Pi cotransporter family protein [Plebeiibacterium marinum]|uniref:Na/Pi cotransporter family protein n=1 Tax=Plebeiibacterium marinum TaxID=2992111 RepID=A0AAE3MD39_9BACT|nr:Na/Pi cotransporter family protein [Plebeiobacterium marinum]MCW3805231.1 Na/Pi cotransporter family protein [Plebeiobacterium marinum]